jgi:hypothetical protein
MPSMVNNRLHRLTIVVPILISAISWIDLRSLPTFVDEAVNQYILVIDWWLRY